MGVFESPRMRRRLGWAAAGVVIAGVVAAAIVLIPGANKPHETLRPGGGVQVAQKEMRLTPASRRAIDALFDAFVPDAVERHDVRRAMPLVTNAFRAGVTRHEWLHGSLPVMPYDAVGRQFHGWTLIYAYPREISVALLLHPAPKEKLGAVAFTAVLKKPRGRWLVDSFVPAASFAAQMSAPKKEKPHLLAQNDFMPGASTPSSQAVAAAPTGRGTDSLSTKWLLVPGIILALIVLVPVGAGITHARRTRRAWRDYHAQSDRGT
jgi:hypothetical protein